MTTVLEAFEAMGMALKESETVCIVFGDEDFREYSLHDVADRKIEANVYFSTGTFRRDQKWGSGGRSLKNVQRILELPFDFDLKDFLKQDKEDIYDLSDDELGGYIHLLQRAVEDIFRQIRMPIHRLDYTGYGLSAHVLVPLHEQDKVKEIKELHAGVVTHINHVYGGILADVQVKDAGPRIMRLIPCLNVGAREDGSRVQPRQSRNIYMQDGYVDELTLRAASQRPSGGRVVQLVPHSGKGLDKSSAQLVIESLRPFWSFGQKHFMGLALGGYLVKNMVPEEQAIEIARELSADDNKPQDRLKAIRDSYARARQGLDVAGWFPLNTMVDPEVLEDLDHMFTEYQKKHGPRLLINGEPVRSGSDLDDKDRPAEFDEYPEPPSEAFYGWFSDYVELMYPTTEATRGFHLACALTIAGAIVGRRVAVKYASEQLYSNQYTLLVGPTGSSRKGTSMKRAYRLPTYRDPSKQTIHSSPFALRRDLGSGASVVKTLREHSNTLVAMEEATTLFSNMHRQGGEALLDRLIEAWDTPDFIQDNVKNNPDAATNPYLSFIAGIQPGRLEDALGANEIESGLANRMGIFFGVRRRVLARAPELDQAQAHHLYQRFYQAVSSYPDGATLYMDEEAGAMWDDWYVSYSSHKGSEDELAMRIRHPDMVQKWALLFAVSDQDQAIRVHHLEAALAVLSWMWNGIKRRLPTWGVSVDNKIEALIRQTLKDRGALKRRRLQQLTARRQWSGREFAMVFRAMVENGHLVSLPNGDVALAEDVERAEAQRIAEEAKAVNQ